MLVNLADFGISESGGFLISMLVLDRWKDAL